MRVPAPPMWLVMIIMWSVIIAGVLYLATCVAHAAEDAVCKPYASDLLNRQMNWLWQRAFNHCKLLEENAPNPPPEGDWQGAMRILDPNYTPLPISEIGNTPAGDKPPMPQERPAAASPPAPVQAAAPARSSASAAAAKCKSTHPSGFQANKGAGTYNVLVGKKWVRVACPLT